MTLLAQSISMTISKHANRSHAKYAVYLLMQSWFQYFFKFLADYMYHFEKVCRILLQFCCLPDKPHMYKFTTYMLLNALITIINGFKQNTKGIS